MKLVSTFLISFFLVFSCSEIVHKTSDPVSFDSDDENAVVVDKRNPSVLAKIKVKNDNHYYDDSIEAGDSVSPSLLDLKMGATVSGSGTVFRFFAPLALQVDLVLYSSSDIEANAGEKFPMTQDENGIWSIVSIVAPHGTFYRYKTYGLLYFDSQKRLEDNLSYVQDPYAKANVGSFGHSIVIDMNDASMMPDGWASHSANTKALNKHHGYIVYETHIANFSKSSTYKTMMNDDYGISVETDELGKFSGMTKAYTYFNDLGVNMVEFMPVNESEIDFKGDNVNATNENSYSWGYMPTHFFSLETSYASGMTGQSIKEFRQLIKTYHDNGIAVILDVVLTHVNNGKNILFQIDPEGRYYFRIDNDGNWLNAGTGNWINDYSAPMARKFVLDNLRYWLEEFKVDGFRFDLIVATDENTMKQARDMIRSINPNAFITGENWKDADRHHWFNEEISNTDTIASGHFKLHISQWNDGFREAVKKYINGETDWSGTSVADRLKQALYFSQGLWDIDGFDRADHPIDTTNYLESHDEESVGHYSGGNKSKIALANTLLLTSLGIPMLHEGQEFGRNLEDPQKDQSEEGNIIDWTTSDKPSKTSNKDLYMLTRYVAKNIRLANDACFARADSADYAGKYNSDSNDGQKNVKYYVDCRGLGESNKEYFIMTNMEDSDHNVNLGTAGWAAEVATWKEGSNVCSLGDGYPCGGNDSDGTGDDIDNWSTITNTNVGGWGVQVRSK